MKHTPEDMYDFCEEKGLLLFLKAASVENQRGFTHGLVKGRLIQKTDDIYARIHVQGKAYDYPTGMPIEQYDRLHRELLPFAMELCLEQKKDKIQRHKLIIQIGKKGEPIEQVEKRCAKESLIEFLEFCEIDTIYKLYELLPEGGDLLQEKLHRRG